jgi:hypothetical protein
MMSVLMAIGAAGPLHPLDAAQVFVARIQPLHRVEHARRSGLYRQMHVIAESRIVVDRIDDLFDEIARMRRREPHAADSLRLADSARAAWRNPNAAGDGSR